MPIDSNIALGVRPIEQPNMLGQMGQFMALRAAQQETESQNALRDFYARGGDINNAESRRQLMSEAPLLGQKIIGQQSEIAARDIGTTEKAIKLYKDQVGSVNDPASAASLLTAVYSNPLTRPFVESMAPLDKALASIPNDPAKLEQWKRGFGLTADKLFVDANTIANNETSRANNAATVGASMYGHNISAKNADQRLQFDREKYENPNRVPVQGRMEIPDANAPGGVRVIETFAGFDPRTSSITPSQVRAPAAPPTVANSLAAQNPAPAVNNALNSNFVTSPSSPVAPSAAATMPNASAVAPSVALPSTAAQAAVFSPKQSAQQEKQAQTDADRITGKAEVGGVISNLATKYQDLAQKGGTTSTKKGVLENIGSYLSSTGAGQELGKMTGAEAQSLRNEIKAQSPILLQGIKKATGMTAKEMDSNADVKRWLEAMGSTTFDIQSTLGILKSLNKQFGTGDEIPSTPAAKSTGGFKYIGPVKE